MKVIWFINNEIPFVNQDKTKNIFVNEGWITGMLTVIKEEKDINIQITIVYPQSKDRNYIYNNIEDIQTVGYYRNWNACKYNKNLEKNFENIINKINPDIIHVMGSEYPHTYSVCCAAERLGILNKVIISIQGLISKCALNYTLGLPNSIIHKQTIRDLIKGNINREQKNFNKRGQYEVLALKKANNVIGRTEWDYACVKQINKDINYYFNNEVLRKKFYGKKWDYEKCDKHTIFISQGGYPIKGLHFLIEAIPIIKEQYPNVKVKIAGYNLLQGNYIKKRSYASYIEKLINKYDIKNQIEFLGMLPEEKIVEEYIKANVFASTSTIENSPNSVGEAMLLGMPIVSSDVGGVKDFITHNETGYIYPCNEPYMLAHYIMKCFEDEENAINMGNNAQKKAINIYNRKENALELERIYNKIIQIANSTK